MNPRQRKIIRRIMCQPLFFFKKQKTAIRVRAMMRYHDHAREWLYARGWTGVYFYLTLAGWRTSIDCMNDGTGMVFGFSKEQKALAIEFKLKWGFAG